MRCKTLFLVTGLICIANTSLAIPFNPNHAHEANKSIHDLKPLNGRSDTDVLTNGKINSALQEVQQQKIQTLLLPPNRHLMTPNLHPAIHNPQPIHGGPAHRLTDIHQTPIATPQIGPTHRFGAPHNP